MCIEFDLVGGPGDGRHVRVPWEHYKPWFDECYWEDFVEPLWARYLPVYEEDRPPRFYRFYGFVNGKWPSAWMWDFEGKP